MERISKTAMWRGVIGVGLLIGASGCWAAADNMHFSGALVAEPCTLRPGDEDIRLDFGTVIDKYLYTYGRTPGKAFSLVLQDCDISLGNRGALRLRRGRAPAAASGKSSWQGR